MKKLNVNELLNSMSIEEKVAQMLCFAFHGTSYNEQVDTLLKKIKVGGVIHFARNIVNPIKACKLNYDIQINSEIPCFIGIDQEGGTVQRIIKDVTPFPGAMALSSSNQSNEKLCYFVGKDLKNMNYNMVFAPVADVNNNPKNPVINSRSYSDNPNVVSKYVIDAFTGFEKANIISTLKHFPGHGDTSVDSHVSLPTVNKSMEELKKVELVPFENAIKAHCPGIMVSHVVYPAFDKVFPATLSKNILTDYLKEELKYEGLIVSDSLTMGAIYQNYTKEEVVKYCCNAGMDLLIFCGKADILEEIEIYETFVRLVKENEISLDRVNYSVRKILEYKNKYCLDLVSNYIYPSKEAIELGKKLSLDSIALYKSNGLVPIENNDNVLIIFPKIKLLSLVENKDQEYVTLSYVFKKYGYNFDEVIIDEDLQNIELIKNIQNKYNKIIFASYNIHEDDYQVKLYNILNKEKVIVISMRSPYDINYLQDVYNYICIYETTELSLNSLVENIIKQREFGQSEFVGKVPVKLN